MVEQFKNNAATTLNGNISNSVTSIEVNDASKLPTNPQFRIKIDDEIMLVTNISTNTLTVTRGVEGTTPTIHTDGTVVEHVLTAAALNNFFGENVTQGSVGNTPNIQRSGQIYFADDIGNLLLSKDGTWHNFSRIHKSVPPPSTGWSWLNQGGATVTETDFGHTISFTGNSGDFRCRMRSINDNSGDLRFIMGVRSTLSPFSNTFTGVLIQNNSGNNRAIVIYRNTSDTRIRASRYSFDSSWSRVNDAFTSDVYQNEFTNIMYYKFEWISNRLYCYISHNTYNWVRIGPANGISQTSAFDLGKLPTTIGWCAGATNNTLTVHAELFHYEEEAF